MSITIPSGSVGSDEGSSVEVEGGVVAVGRAGACPRAGARADSWADAWADPGAEAGVGAGADCKEGTIDEIAVEAVVNNDSIEAIRLIRPDRST